MPRGNGTGPMGLGPMTGRGAGYCSGFATPGYANQIGTAGSFGFGRGRGLRRMCCLTGVPGWTRFGYPESVREDAVSYDEKAFLSNQAEFLENQLGEIKKRLSSLNQEAD